MENYSQGLSATTSNVYAVTRDAASSNTTNIRGASGGNNNLSTPGPRSNAQRPPALRKPRPRKTSFQGDQVAQEMRPVLHFFDVFSRKLYIEGYLCRQVLSPSSSQQEWIEYFAELCGPMLSLWKLVDSGESEVSPTPIVINISNYSTEICSPTSDSGLQRINVFFVNAGQDDRFYLQAPNEHSLNMWVGAIRLSCYEGSRLQEVYTATLLKRPGLRDFLAGSVLTKGKLEGYLQVQFNFADEPKKYWVVVSEHRSEDKKKKSDLAFARGQALFYETKKSKKPFMSIANVLQTYATCPENPIQIDKTFTFRVEGDLFPAKPTENKPGAFVILTAESLNEMTKWVVGFLDSFKLYGRPKELLYDFKNQASPFFAVPTGRSNTKLFLDLSEVEHVKMHESLADVKAAFSEVLRQSFQSQQQNQDISSQHLNPVQHAGRRISVQNIATDNSSPTSSLPSTLRSTSSSTRPYSVTTFTQGSQRGSISTTTTTSSSSSSLILPPYGERKSQYGQIPNSKPGQSRRTKQLQSSDDDSDAKESGNSRSESESENDNNTKILKGTREDVKITIEEFKGDKSAAHSFKKIMGEPIQLGTEFGSLGGSDLMSEILTAVAERSDDKVEQVLEIPEKQSKPKRSVSFKNQPLKSKNQGKKKPAPLPSESESSEEDSPGVTRREKNDSSSDEGSDSETLAANKNKDSSVKVITKSSRKNRNIKMKSLPSDSSDNDEDSNEDDRQRMASQSAQSARQSHGYDPYRQSSSAYGRQLDTAEEASRGGKKGKKPIRPQESEDESIEYSNSDKEEVRTESEGENEPISPVNKKSPNDNQDNSEISLKTDLTDLDVNLGALTIDPAEVSIISTESRDHQTVTKKEAKAAQESITSEEETSEDDTANRTRKVFKPTKQKDKQKKISNVISSGESSSEESNSVISEEEPLAVLVDEVGYNPNYARPNFNPRPRSVSPNYQQGLRPGPGGYYMENPGYPIDNRRSMTQTPYRGGDYYDDDRASVASFGGRSRSAMGLAPTPPNRRRISGGNMDYARESLYLDDGYYDDRGNPFPIPNHFRPHSLLDSLPQSQLSAREQELMARETGTPLINLPERQKDPQTGLVGAITAREHQRRVMGPSQMSRNQEFERERAFERERERRLMEQRQQMIMVERERESMYQRQSFVPPPGGPNRFYNNQPFLDPAVGQRGSYYEHGYYGPADDEDEDDDVPLGVGGSVSSIQPRSQQGTRGRRRDTG